MSHQNDNTSETDAAQKRPDDVRNGAKAERSRSGEASGNDQDAASERLDQGLEETFPSSDPVSVKVTK